MRLLGAILAGGQSRRFGSDKAQATWRGERLIDIVAGALASQTQALVVCGRTEPEYKCLEDRPEPGLGPLGGLNAALHHCQASGFDGVLSAGCDVFNLPPHLASVLAANGAAIVQSQPVIGFWPVAFAGELEDFLADGGRALYGFADRIGARLVHFDPPLANVNEPADLPG